ncbi:hypothetical protein CGRA01v4_02889 [Colletotrichum graminicola]|nr:hypothetical protein CGRA01v4_02889 [Colletotrichum graminicola]
MKLVIGDFFMLFRLAGDIGCVC